MLASKNTSSSITFFYGAITFFLACTVLGLFTEMYFLALIPLVSILLGLYIIDYRNVYLAFFMVVPFSMDYYIGSMGMEVPTEPIMILLTGTSFFLFCYNVRKIKAPYILHTVTTFLILHICWIFFSTLFAHNIIFSLKYLIAKLWYIIPFYFLTMHIYSESFISKVFKTTTIFMLIATIIVLIRHYQYDFDFNYYNEVVYPIFPNHVIYAAMQVVILPFTWLTWKSEKNGILKAFWLLSILILIIGINFSYTRAAQACIVIAIIAYYIVKMKWLKPMLIAAFLTILSLGIYLVNNNKYLDFQPDFERAVTQRSYENLLESTLKMEDISTMERVYRWVAGGHMVAERPWTGHGPNNFYYAYREYTENGFKTYVSNNPEKSGIHNYFLMVLVEQGIIGFIIYLFVNFGTLVMGEKLYHKLQDPFEKRLVMASLCSIIVISALHMMNDLLEVDKIGPFYFMSLAFIVILSVKKSK